MANCVFTTRIDSIYDDLPEIRYHFPRTYLNQIRQAIGDWIVYYEPKSSGGRLAYYAIAKVERIDPDPIRPDHYYAFMSSYIDFTTLVPFRLSDRYVESSLNKSDGSLNKGYIRRAVRLLPISDFQMILNLGFQGRLERPNPAENEIRETSLAFDRPRVDQMVSRPFRDIQFTRQVRIAYDATCAMTGLKLINGGGRCEIEAAHIRPVGDGHNGPDSVRNGIALSRTCHWMFDRGLVSIDNDYRMIVAEKKIPDQALRLLNPSRKLIIPKSVQARPHRQFLEYHREVIFKG